MKLNLSPMLKKAIELALIEAEQEGAILDVYGAAARIQHEHPHENVALEVIASALLSGRGSIQAIEFMPPTSAVLEVILPASDDEAVEPA